MKSSYKRVTGILFLLIFTLSSTLKAQNQGYKYNFKINGLKDTVVYLANYYGKKQYYKDTAVVDNKGRFLFEGDSLAGGIYLIVLPDKQGYFEFIVNEPAFTIETDTSDLIGNIKITGSAENQQFYAYMAKMSEFSKKSQDLNAAKNAAQEEATKSSIQSQLDALSKEVSQFQKDFTEQNKNLFVSKVFKASIEPDLPDLSHIEDEKERQKINYNLYKKAYLENVDFGDIRMLRTPILHNKMEFYMTKLTLQIPDSINKSADVIMQLSEAEKEIYRYMTIWITNHYEKSNLMGMDAVFVHMAQNYYTEDRAYWVDSAKMEKIQDRARTLAPLLLDKPAPNLILADTTEKKWVNLKDVQAKYTILYFWDPNCGHCKKATPKLGEFYNDKKSTYNLEVYAVNTELKNDDWRKFIRKHNLNWINVSDSPEINKDPYPHLKFTDIKSLNFRDTYDIFSTPQMYILDENKVIIGKKVGVEQLEDFLQNYEKSKEQ